MDDEVGQLILSPQPVDRKKLLMLVHPLKVALESEYAKNEALLSDREHLLQIIELRGEQYASRLSLLDWQIENMKSEEVKMRKYNSTKLECLLATKEREALSCKINAELAEKDLEEAHTRIAALHAENKALMSKLKNEEPSRPIGACDNTELKDLKLEIRNLKHGYKNLKSEKEAQLLQKENQIEALVAEKDFVWNQYKIMESEYVTALKSKNSELDKSNEAFEMLKRNIEEMEASVVEKNGLISKLKDEMAASISEKDSTIAKLKDEMAASISEKDGIISQLEQKFKASISKKDDMLSRLSGECEKFKKMMKEKDQMISGLHADVAKFAARAGPKCSNQDSGTSRTLRSGVKRARESVSLAPSASQSVSGQRQQSNRSQGSASASTAETPRLFSSSFKVPKLKNTTTKSGIPTSGVFK